MKAYLKKHPMAVAGILCVLALLFGFAYWQRQQVLSNTTESKIKDLPRQDTICENTFYYDQLNEREQAAYQTMIRRLEEKKGGVTQFPEPLTGKEYLRVISALENSNGQYFYGLFEIPMNDEDFYMRYKERDLARITDRSITKVILFQSFSKGLDQPGDYDEYGRVTNLKEIDQLLSQNQEEKQRETEQKEEQVQQMLEEILAGIPENAGEKKTVDYFLTWMKEHLELNTEIGIQAYQFSSMSEVLEQAYIYHNLSCLLEKKASISGFNKLLAELCRRSGMDAHIVQGVWGRAKTEAYELCAVTLGGETYYVDASGAKAGEFGNQTYLAEQEARNHMQFVDYFSYSE